MGLPSIYDTPSAHKRFLYLCGKELAQNVLVAVLAVDPTGTGKGIPLVSESQCPDSHDAKILKLLRTRTCFYHARFCSPNRRRRIIIIPFIGNAKSSNVPNHPQRPPTPPTPPSQNYIIPEAYGTDISYRSWLGAVRPTTQKWHGGK